MKNTQLLFFCLIFCVCYAQQNKLPVTKIEIEKEIANAKEKNKINPVGALQDFLRVYKESTSIDYDEGIVKSCSNIISIYFNQGDNEKTIEYSNILENSARNINDNEALTKAYGQKAVAYSRLGLYNESYKEFQKTLNSIKKYKNIDKLHYDMSLTYQNILEYYQNVNAPQDTILNCLKKSLREAELINDRSKYVDTDHKYDMISYLNMNLGMFYTGIHKPQRLDLGEEYLQQSLQTINNWKFTKTKPNKIPILNALGRFYIEKNDFNKALGYAYEVVKIEKNHRSPDERVLAFATITNSYEGLNKKDSLIKYMQLYTNLTDSITHVEKKQANTAIKKITAEKAKYYKKNLNQIILLSLFIIFFIITIGWLLWKRNKQRLHKKYRIIIENLKNNNNHNQPVDSTVENTMNITDSTINSLVIKLQKFEESQKFIRKDVSLTNLANSLNTNTRYLSEVIKKYKKKSFNNYINGLRIQYITELLYNNPKYREYKISYLASVCGFASREVFAVVFKKETGVSPSYFISQLQADKDEK